VYVAGLVLVRQRPGTATGVTFVTIEDETGIANLIVWSTVFERQRRVVLGARMLGCRGRLQREGDVIYVIADELEDFSGALQSIGGRDEPLAITHGHGDSATPPRGLDPREGRAGGHRRPGAGRSRQEPEIAVPTRDFR
jgi:error-prone DNA polymerase